MKSHIFHLSWKKIDEKVKKYIFACRTAIYKYILLILGSFFFRMDHLINKILNQTIFFSIVLRFLH